MNKLQTPLCEQIKSQRKKLKPTPQSNPNDKSCVEIPEDLSEEELEALLRPSD